MDCKTAHLLLDFARPACSELGPGDAEALDGHLADCPDCAALARRERQLDEPLARAMKAVPVPDDLRPRLLRRLAVERDAWYRRLLLRCLGVAAAATLLFLLLWGGWLWHANQRPEIDWGQALADAGLPEQRPERIEGWFKETYGIHTTLPSPRDFEYNWLVHYGLADFGGQRVPMLLFAYSGQDSQALAQVYIITDAQFADLHNQLNQPPRGSGAYKTKLLRNPENPSVYYFVIYTDGAEGRFWSRKKPPL